MTLCTVCQRAMLIRERKVQPRRVQELGEAGSQPGPLPSASLQDEPTTGMDPQARRMLWNTIVGTQLCRDPAVGVRNGEEA